MVIYASVSFFVVEVREGGMKQGSFWDDFFTIVAVCLALGGSSSVGLLILIQAQNFCSGQTTPERLSKTKDTRKGHLEVHTGNLLEEGREFDTDTYDYKKDRSKMNTLSLLDDSYLEDALGEEEFTRFTSRSNAE